MLGGLFDRKEQPRAVVDWRAVSHSVRVPTTATRSDAFNVAFSVRRVFVSGEEPSSVEIYPPELRPWGVRFDFRYAEGDDGERGWAFRGYAVIEPPGSGLPEFTPTLRRKV